MNLSLAFLQDSDLYTKVIHEGILQAREKVRIATATLKNVHAKNSKGKVESAVKVLFDLARRGVTVEILHGSPPSAPLRKELSASWPPPGGRVRLKLCPRVHFKAVVVDYSAVYFGSANFTGAGMGCKSPRRRNFEMGAWTHSEEILDSVNMAFDRIWYGGECKDCGRRNVCFVPLEQFEP